MSPADNRVVSLVRVAPDVPSAVHADPSIEEQVRLMRIEVHELLRIVKDLEGHVKPALEAVANGGLFSMLMGRRK